MIKSSALQLLGLKENASKREIKKAYARLLIKYHPEENPDEFKLIHEAYVSLQENSNDLEGEIIFEYSNKERKKEMSEIQKEELNYSKYWRTEKNLDVLLSVGEMKSLFLDSIREQLELNIEVSLIIMQLTSNKFLSFKNDIEFTEKVNNLIKSSKYLTNSEIDKLICLVNTDLSI
ncbi:DnaJ domain-containing protein [Anaerorhabdus furcosa]|uniref:DnaJ domain-containing protein n=1 Tax=Anaerorhabdus furcosa TaxID=118967 RepID=A0A1T4PDX3_9FIRM|nr:DnaJ domain-containing protein [Anaerorhabdus furcosa]SJZ89744.1 DnaJ domain-containing protein [Anaerorhabdus furcosa]